MSNCVTYDPVTFACLTGFSKPAYQKKLPGKYRQLPDVSWLADPFTGGVIAISIPFQIPSLTWQVWGGTSPACPMFSALWAIANQEAGTPLGLAAPYLYSLPTGAVTDIVPVTMKHNVTGSIQESATITVPYNAAQNAGRLGFRQVRQRDMGLCASAVDRGDRFFWPGLLGGIAGR